MAPPPPPTVLWSPPPDARRRTRVGHYLDWLTDRRGLRFDGYDELWRWSVADLEGFWGSIVEFFEVDLHQPATAILPDARMPGARWLPGATLNWAEEALRLRARSADDVAVIARSEARDEQRFNVTDLREQVARARAGLLRLGVRPGDRVAAYLPNIAEALVAVLATASIGAVWSSCAPEFGVRSVIDRFGQIEPALLLAVDGYRYGGKAIDRSDEVAAIRAALPGLRATVLVAHLRADAATPEGAISWDELLAEPGELAFEAVPFDHPLFVLYSSGTTGLPKPIVHGHGGILLEHLKVLALHHDLGAADRFCWYTTTGWMMWNYLISGLLVDATVVCYDGSPAHPDLLTLWRLASELEITCLGASAPFLMACARAGIEPGRTLDLGHLRSVGSTGAPLPAKGFRYVYESVGRDLQLASVSGGTDVCTAFVGASPLVPVWEGEISCRQLGCRIEAFDQAGRALIGEEGELVITAPMPSMPVGFWNDPDGSRYREAYFGAFPGVWRHGDWVTITDRGSLVISGRSDATLNRGGVRIGTAEFYAVVEAMPEVADAVVVHLEEGDELLLFIALRPGNELTDELRARIAAELRSALSPRHVPDRIIAVPGVPRTLSGKKLEVPVKRILAGASADQAASRGSLANPDSLDAFIAFREARRTEGKRR